MILLYAALLGVVQGLTEFLPISSSAHLILARAFFGWDAETLGIAFDVACHVGTMLALLLYFRRELATMAMSVPSVFSGSEDAGARGIRLIVAATAPIVVVGVLFGDFVERSLRTPAIAAAALVAGAVLLWIAERAGKGARGEDSLTMTESVGLGVAQAAALVPGVSRSGATIAVGMLLGLRREAAARFTFLIAVPAILAAAAKEALVVLRQGPMTLQTAQLFGMGVATSALVGYVTVKYFVRYLAGHSLDLFAFYRLALAAVALLWLIN